MRNEKIPAKIAVVTRDIKFYSIVAKKLREKDEKFLSITPEEEIPSNVEVVITTPEEEKIIKKGKKQGKIRIISGESGDKAFDEFIFLKSGKKYSTLLIGIDPGKNIGISVAGLPESFVSENGKSNSAIETVYEAEVKSRKELVSIIRKVCRKVKFGKIRIKVGRKGSWYRDLIINDLLKNFRFDIELVDEHRTSKLARHEKEKSRSINIISAREIAFKEGKKIEKNKEKNITLGEIKAIQKESRKISGNITISRRLAESVLKGELSIKKAIELQRKAAEE